MFIIGPLGGVPGAAGAGCANPEPGKAAEGVSIAAGPPDEFAQAFEASFARLQVAVEEAAAKEEGWARRAAAAVVATLEFAAANPEAALVLTNEALARGAEGIARHERVIGYAAEHLASGRAIRPQNSELPDITERALVGGLAMLVAQRLDQGRHATLLATAPEMIEFVLTPYVGADQARDVANGT